MKKKMRKISSGKCNFCNNTFSKLAITKHLSSCEKRKKENSDSEKIKIFHLIVEDRYLPKFWLHLEVSELTSLKYIDKFLRKIWVECCGHLSMFKINNINYSIQKDPEFPEDEDMSWQLKDLIKVEDKFSYEYDFGSTTELKLKVISEREGDYNTEFIKLLARNEQPIVKCKNCEKEAIDMCFECLGNTGEEKVFCKECSEKHECGDDSMCTIVNSPRFGVCGYTGND